mmetsp:Transcript_8377/g.24127  ORF Transcript_8377/g.24127 Transcript_8377/m.24127 type:complete len:242 (+) Transcript_8377:3141-3866(+)
MLHLPCVDAVFGRALEEGGREQSRSQIGVLVGRLLFFGVLDQRPTILLRDLHVVDEITQLRAQRLCHGRSFDVAIAIVFAAAGRLLPALQDLDQGLAGALVGQSAELLGGHGERTGVEGGLVLLHTNRRGDGLLHVPRQAAEPRIDDRAGAIPVGGVCAVLAGRGRLLHRLDHAGIGTAVEMAVAAGGSGAVLIVSFGEQRRRSDHLDAAVDLRPVVAAAGCRLLFLHSHDWIGLNWIGFR